MLKTLNANEKPKPKNGFENPRTGKKTPIKIWENKRANISLSSSSCFQCSKISAMIDIDYGSRMKISTDSWKPEI